MNPDVKKKWVEALRSGAYHQGTGQLRCNDQFCCLGVLCDLFKDDGQRGDWVADDCGFAFEVGAESCVGVLPIAVQDWAGLNVYDPGIGGDQTLVELNDNGLFSFGKIADIIEANL